MLSEVSQAQKKLADLKEVKNSGYQSLKRVWGKEDG